MKLLLSHGASVNKRNENDESVFHIAARENNEEMIKLLLQYNPDQDIVNKQGKKPLNLTNSEKIRKVIEGIGLCF